MNEIDVNQYILLDDCAKHIYKGILSSDELANIERPYKSLHIVNTDPSYLSGSHWIAVYSYDDACEIFDSLGNNPEIYSKHFSKFLDEYRQVKYSTVKLQSEDSIKCGIFCIYYSFYRSRGFTLEQIVNTLCKDTEMNESMMDAFIAWYKSINA